MFNPPGDALPPEASWGGAHRRDWHAQLTQSLARDMCQNFCPCKGQDAALDPLDPKLSIAASPWEGEGSFEQSMREVLEQTQHSDGPSPKLPEEVIHSDPWPHNCREELKQLLRTRFLDYSVLWPDKSYALSQIYEPPPQHRTSLVTSTEPKKETKSDVTKMAAELSQSMRRIPKREEDILRLRHFHSMKERGRNNRPFPQPGRTVKGDLMVREA